MREKYNATLRPLYILNFGEHVLLSDEEFHRATRLVRCCSASFRYNWLALFLLKNCFSIPKLHYSLRCAAWYTSDVLPPIR